MVLGNLSEASKTIRTAVNQVSWTRIFSFDYISNMIGRIIFGIAILLSFNFAFGYIAQTFLSKPIQLERHFDSTRRGDVSDRTIMVPTMYGTTFQFVMLLLTLAIMAHILGIEIATIVIVFVFIAVIIIALIQGTISNIIASLLISYFHTYEVGDIIKVNDVEGQVVDFNSMNTTIDDISSVNRVTIPNKLMYASMVTNYSKSLFFVETFTMTLSNYNKDFKKIIRIIEEDLSDATKYPSIFRDEDAQTFRVGIDSCDQHGTKIVIHVPFNSTYDLINNRMRVRTNIRQLLSDHDVRLLDNYVYPINETSETYEKKKQDEVRDEYADYEKVRGPSFF